MDVFGPNSADRSTAGGTPSLDPRLRPTPDYGSLGPDSDFAKTAATPSQNAAIPSTGRRALSRFRSLQLLATMAGIVGALVALSSHGSPAWGKITGVFAPQRTSSVFSARVSDRDLDGEKPQRQAEILLTRAVSRSDAAAQDEIETQIQSRAEGWRGKLKLDSQLSQLTTAGLNSTDRSVQASAIEVQLAAYGLSKKESSVDALVRQADSQDHTKPDRTKEDHAKKVWALWALGLLGNRGVETDRVVQVLTAHLKNHNDNDEDSRRWAVEGLALVGTTPTIVPLLAAMHDDPSALVRERAACSLAESGTLSHEQRLAAVPQLITYSEDPTLDAQTQGWAFQALGDITKQRLPNDSAAWREWYRNAAVVSQ